MGFYLHRFQHLRSYHDKIGTLLFTKDLQLVFQLQKGHRQPSTILHIYIVTRPPAWDLSIDLNQCELSLGNQVMQPLG